MADGAKVVHLRDARVMLLKRQRSRGNAPSSLRHHIDDDGLLVVEQMDRFGEVVETYQADQQATEELLIHLVRRMAEARSAKEKRQTRRRKR